MEVGQAVHSELEAVDEAIHELHRSLQEGVQSFGKEAIAPIGQAYNGLILKIGKRIGTFLEQVQTAPPEQVISEADKTANNIEVLLKEFSQNEFKDWAEGMNSALEKWRESQQEAYSSVPEYITRNLSKSQLQRQPADSKQVRKVKRQMRLYGFRSEATLSIPFREAVKHHWDITAKPDFHQALGQFSLQNFHFINRLRQLMSRQLKLLVLSLHKQLPEERIAIIEQRTIDFKKKVREMAEEATKMAQNTENQFLDAISHSLKQTVLMVERIDVKHALQQRQKRVNESALEMLNQRLVAFPKVWQQNQAAFHRQLQAEIWFGRISLSIYRYSHQTREKLHREFIRPLTENANHLTKGLAALTEAIQADKDTAQLKSIRLNEQIFLNTEIISSNLETTTDSLVHSLPDAYKLLQADLHTTPIEFTRVLPTISIALNSIADYLIKTNFTENHRRNLTETGQSLRRLNNRLVNSANLIAYSLEIASDEDDRRGLKEMVAKSAEELDKINLDLAELEVSAMRGLTDGQNNTLAALDLKSVVSRADQLKQYVNRETSSKPLNQWIEDRKQTLKNWTAGLRNFIVLRRHDVALAHFEKKNEQIANEGELVQNFIEDIQLSDSINQKLPYYYKQLFSGKHLNNATGVHIRADEIALAKKAVGRIQKGSGGAIAVIGDVLTGKTFLTNYIASQLIQGKTIRISPPVGGSHLESDVLNAILKACGSGRANVNSALASLEAGSVLVFNDLEQWWLKHPNGDEAIMAITRLIRKFGRRHYFILSCSSYSFKLISKRAEMENYLASTIMIKPATQSEMREIIWMRHTTGAMVVQQGGKKVEQLLGTFWDSLMGKFYRRTNGNIGLALQLWLRSIDEVEGNTITIRDKGMPRFPDISNANWKVLTYQLFIHRILSKARLMELFEDEDPQWLGQNLGALKRIGIIEETGKDVYELNAICRPYIEKWLTELNLVS